MGGSVAMTIRQENGLVFKTACSTGDYNSLFFSQSFNDGHLCQAVEDYVAIFDKMKLDYETGEPYSMSNSSFYGKYNELAPRGYGLVVLDFKEKKIHTMQDYDVPGLYHLGLLSPYIVYEQRFLQTFDYLISNNLLDVCHYGGAKVGDMISLLGSNCSLNSLYQALATGELRQTKPGTTVDFQGFTMLAATPKILSEFQTIHYNENLQDLSQYIATLHADGFTFNHEDIKAWKNRLSELSAEEWVSEEECQQFHGAEFQARIDDNKLLALSQLEQYVSIEK